MIDADFVREFMKDIPSLNFLNNNKIQFDDDLIDIAIKLTKEDVWSTYPALKKHLDKIPDVVMVYGVVSRLLESESFLQLRNKIAVQDNNNTSTSLYGKEEEYIRLASMFKQEFYKRLDSIAKAIFYGTCWDSDIPSNSEEIESGYAAIFDLWYP